MESSLKCAFIQSSHTGAMFKDGIDGQIDSIRLLLPNRNYANHKLGEHNYDGFAM